MARYFERNEEKKEFAEETVATGPDMGRFNTETYKQNTQVKR